jgi:tRNA A37 methylthiotransferase MiaB
MMKYSDETFEALRRAGCAMIFFGAESGSNERLKEMNKDLRAEDTLALASRIRRFRIIPEFSIIFGNPKDPEGDTHECIDFIRQLKRLNPEAEIIVEHYTPVPQRARMYGDVEDQVHFPTTPDEWATDHWQRFRDAERSSDALAQAYNQATDRQLRTGGVVSLANDSGHSPPELGSASAEGAEQLALSARGIRIADGTEMAAASDRAAKAQG